MSYSLETLGLLVGAGLLVVALLQWRLGWARRAVLGDEEAVRRRVLDDLPELQILEIVHTSAAALVWTETGTVALAICGDKHWTRPTRGAEAHQDGAVLQLAFPDAGAPHFAIELPEDIRGTWLERVRA